MLFYIFQYLSFFKELCFCWTLERTNFWTLSLLARISQVTFTISTLTLGSPFGTIHVMSTIESWSSKSGRSGWLLGPIRRKTRKRKRKRKTRRTKRRPKVLWWVSLRQASTQSAAQGVWGPSRSENSSELLTGHCLILPGGFFSFSF